MVGGGKIFIPPLGEKEEGFLFGIDENNNNRWL